MEALLPGIKSRNEYVDKLRKATEDRLKQNKNYIKKKYKEQMEVLKV